MIVHLHMNTSLPFTQTDKNNNKETSQYNFILLNFMVLFRYTYREKKKSMSVHVIRTQKTENHDKYPKLNLMNEIPK